MKTVDVTLGGYLYKLPFRIGLGIQHQIKKVLRALFEKFDSELLA